MSRLSIKISDYGVVTKTGRATNTDKNNKPAESKKRTKKDIKEKSNDISPVKRSRGKPEGITKKKIVAQRNIEELQVQDDQKDQRRILIRNLSLKSQKKLMKMRINSKKTN
ncbi:hypothetical protein WA026_001434 [Henosepilachna vigintioctopunctata]|uniref:Uncharacterized protein n=1 Tax=Henosepilachna vigintioctopunctata TaxID=420089 RepID=A0AAW1UQC4_9CUCU